MTVLRFGLTPKMKPVSPRRATVVAGLDIGTSKIACMIARLEPKAPQDVLRRRSHGVQVLGFAHTAASGMKAGGVVDLVEVEEMVRQAIEIAESKAKVQLESVVVSLSGGRLGSERFVANVELAGGAVTDNDIGRVLAAASRHSVRDGRAVLHSLPIGYTLDAVTGIREPRGMLGQRFGVDMHMVTSDVATVRNLMLVVERSHLEIEALVAAPYMAGLACLADDESDLGAATIDLGAGTTTLAVFSGGKFVHADGFALGGQHVTMDLARGLNTRIADAERIKAIYGSVLTGGSDERDMITVPPVGDDEREPPQFVARASDRAHHQAAGRGNPGNGARPAQGFAVRGRAARAHRAHRRRQPACPASPILPRVSCGGRCASAVRLAWRACRTRPRVRHSPWRRASWSIRRRHILNTSNRGKRGN